MKGRASRRRLRVLAFGLLALGSPAFAGAGPAAEAFDSVFGIYEQNRQQGRPNYVTQDLLLLAYALIRERAWAETEQSELLPQVGELFRGLHQALANGPDDEAGHANLELASLLVALMDDSAGPPAGERARAEWELVHAAAAVAPSPLFGARIDYSQFRPRGRYTATPALAGYFRAVRYAQTALFGVQPSASTGLDEATAGRLAVQAARLAALIDGDETLARGYRRIDDLLASRFGPADDLQVADVLVVSRAADSTDATLARRLATHALAHDRLPRITSGVVDPLRLEPGLTAARALSGWRLLAARYTPESAALQGLVWKQVGRHQCSGDCPPPFTLSVVDGLPVKGMPNVLELPALLGSGEARQALTRAGDDRYEGYAEAWGRAREQLDADADESGPAAARLTLLRAGFDAAAGAPAARERLTAMLGFWTYQRRLDQLYVKQGYTLAGKGLELPSPGRQRSGAMIEVEALPLLRALLGFVEHEQAVAAHPGRLAFRELLTHCIGIVERLQAGSSVDAQDEDFLNRLDQALLGLAGEGDAPVIVDLHTDTASAEVLELATGPAREIRHGPATGARISVHQFRQPLSGRMTDADWRARLRSGEVPPPIDVGAGV